MSNGVMILADDGSDPRRSANVGQANSSWDNISIAGAPPTQAGDGFTMHGTVSVRTDAALIDTFKAGIVSGEAMRAALLDEPEDDVPLDEARRIASHRQREIEGLLGD